MKKYFISLIGLLIIINGYSQITSNYGGKSVENTDLKTSLGVGSGVNEFSGVFGSSISLGSVSTPTGLSYSQSLNYSSVYNSGDNNPLVSGMPFGEGWNLSVPTISIVPILKLKFSKLEEVNMTLNPSQYVTSEYTPQELLNINKVFYATPFLNIPNRFSGLLILKCFDENTGASIWVPSNFTEYFEVYMDGGANNAKGFSDLDKNDFLDYDFSSSVWTVNFSNGDKYIFNIVQNQIIPANSKQLPINTLLNNSSACPVLPGSSFYHLNVVEANRSPRVFPTKWYASEIVNLSKSKFDKIKFNYITSDPQNYYKSHFYFYSKRISNANAISSSKRTEFFEDILLESIVAYGESSAGRTSIGDGYVYEKLELSYEEVFGLNSSNNEIINSNFQGSQPSSKGFYNEIEVYSSDLNNWNRYTHIAKVPGYTQTPRTVNNGYVTDVGNLYAKKLGSSRSFDNSFLESNAIELDNVDGIYPGEKYVVEFVIHANSGLDNYCNFDFNLIAGNESGPITNTNTYTSVTNESFNDKGRIKLFSTFSNMAKPNLYYMGNVNQAKFSFEFTMPNNINDLKLFAQVGPANNDMDNSINANPNTVCYPFPWNYSFGYYKSINNSSSKASEPIPFNFGTGHPWLNELVLLTDHKNLPLTSGSDPLQKMYEYWANPSNAYINGANFQPANIPTLADGNKFTIGSFKIIRKAKLPKMLKFVKKYVAYNSDDELDAKLFLQTLNELNYESKLTKLYKGVFSIYNQEPRSYSDAYRILLKSIVNKSLNPNGTENNPMVLFEYKESQEIKLCGEIPFPPSPSGKIYFPKVNSHCFLLTKITDIYGAETKINYNEIIGEDPDNSPIINTLDNENFRFDLLPENFIKENQSDISKIYKLNTPNESVVVTYTVSDIEKSFQEDKNSIQEYTYLNLTENINSPLGLPDVESYNPVIYNRKLNPLGRKNKENGFAKVTTKNYIKTISTNTKVLKSTTENLYSISYLTFGKLLNQKIIDPSKGLIQENINEYEPVLAFKNGLLSDITKIPPFDYYNQEIWGSTYSNFVKNRPSSTTINIRHFFRNFGSELLQEIYYSNEITIDENDPRNHAYFIKKTKDINKFYDTFHTIISTKEYEYFDADYRGRTFSNGFKYVLNKPSFDGSENGKGYFNLKYRPSFSLYSVKEYSNTDLSFFNLTENFYYFDLKNHINVFESDFVNYYPYIATTNSSVNFRREYMTFDGLPEFIENGLPELFYVRYYNLSNIPYEKRITNEKTNSTYTTSEYYIYKIDYDNNKNGKQSLYETPFELQRIGVNKVTHNGGCCPTLNRNCFRGVDYTHNSLPIPNSGLLINNTQNKNLNGNIKECNERIFPATPLNIDKPFYLGLDHSPAKFKIKLANLYPGADLGGIIKSGLSNVLTQLQNDTTITLHAYTVNTNTEDLIRNFIDSFNSDSLKFVELVPYFQRTLFATNELLGKDLNQITMLDSLINNSSNDSIGSLFFNYHDFGVYFNNNNYDIEDLAIPNPGSSGNSNSSNRSKKSLQIIEQFLQLSEVVIQIDHEIKNEYSSKYSLYNTTSFKPILKWDFVPHVQNQPEITSLFKVNYPYLTLTKQEILEYSFFNTPALHKNEIGLLTKIYTPPVIVKNLFDLADGKVFKSYFGLNVAIGKPTKTIIGFDQQFPVTNETKFYPSGLPAITINSDGFEEFYQYDGLGRILFVTRESFLGPVVSEAKYSNWLTEDIYTSNTKNLNQLFSGRMLHNFIETKSNFDPAGNNGLINKIYYDPSGKEIKSVKQAFNVSFPNGYDNKTYYSGDIYFDEFNNPIKLGKPFELSHSNNLDLSFNGNPNNANIFMVDVYDGTLNNKLLLSKPFHNVTNTVYPSSKQLSYYVDKTFFINELNPPTAIINDILPNSDYFLLRTESISMDDNITVTYSSQGKVVASYNVPSPNNKIITYSKFNSRGLAEIIYRPNGQEWTYKYNHLGWLIEENKPENGKVQNIYNQSGQIIAIKQDDLVTNGLGNSRLFDFDIFGRLIKQYTLLLDIPIQNSSQVKNDFANTWHNILPFYSGFNETVGVENPEPYQIIASSNDNIKSFAWVDFVLESPVNGVSPSNPEYSYNFYDFTFGDKLLEKEFYYDTIDENNFFQTYFIQSYLHDTITYINNNSFKRGKLTYSVSYSLLSNNLFPVHLELFSYDERGLKNKQLQLFSSLGLEMNPSSEGFSESNERKTLVFHSIWEYDFTGNVIINKLFLNGLRDQQDPSLGFSNSQPLSKIKQFEFNFDKFNNVSSVYERRYYDEQILVKLIGYEYDFVYGFLKKKTYYQDSDLPLCNSKIIDEVVFDYISDARNRLSGIQSKFFNQELKYDDFVFNSSNPYAPNSSQNFDGNINGVINTYNLFQPFVIGAPQSGYFGTNSIHIGYQYDGLKRLTNVDVTDYNLQNGLIGLNLVTSKYGDEEFIYDNIGNIDNAIRYNFGPDINVAPSDNRDNLKYFYNSNSQLTQVRDLDLGSIYNNLSYNEIGSLSTDTRKQLNSISYDRSHYPSLLIKGMNETFTYLYNSGDQRIYDEQLNSNNEFAYFELYTGGMNLGRISFKPDKGYDLDYITIDQGLVHKYSSNDKYNPNYRIHDYLGNTRVVYETEPCCDCNSPNNGYIYNILQVVDYFAYGKPMNEYVNNNLNNYDPLYAITGNLREPELELDYKNARFYDYDLSRFLRVDPLASQAPGWTPYRFGFNNPIRYIDPNGLFETESEAKQWAKDNNKRTGWFSRNKVEQESDGSWAVNNRKEGVSYFKDASLDGLDVIGRSGDGVIKSPLVTAQSNNLITKIASNIWNSTFARSIVPDKISVSFSSSINAYAGKTTDLSFNWITRGPDAQFTPYALLTVGGQIGPKASADALINFSSGHYATLDMRSLQRGQAKNGLLGWSAYGSVSAGFGLGGSISGSVGFQDLPFVSRPTWISAGLGFGPSIGAGATGGVSYSLPIVPSQFK